MPSRNPFRVTPALLCLAASARAAVQTALFDRYGDSAGDQYGTAVASVGDVDADGAQDWAVGAPFDDVAASNAGMARVYSGRNQMVLHTWRGSGGNQNMGSALARAGDLDGDGHDDVLVGAPGGGYVVAFSGASGLVLHTFVGGASSAFGSAIAGGGFIDGDGVPDVLVGEPYANAGGAWRGRMHAFSGASGSSIRIHDGSLNYGTLGWSVAFLGDVDGDGRDEYVAGAPAAWNNFTVPLVRAFRGASGAVLWTNNTAAFSDEFGWSLAPIGDISGDGLRDLMVGAMQDAGIGCGGCTGKGFVRAVSGATGAPLYQVNSAAGYYTGLGWAVTAIGDLNGDGYEDFAASRPGTEGCGGTGALSVQVRDGHNGALILSLAPPAGSEQFGIALASGDANGDGLRDLICAAPCSGFSGLYAGSAHAYTMVRSVVTYCDAKVNSLGCTPAISGVGSPSATLAQVFDVRATNELNNKSGLLFYGFKPRETPFQGGHMCVVSPTVRTALQSSAGNPAPDDCSGIYSLDFNARIQSGVDPLLIAGEEVFAQYWSRDPASGSTTNLSDALAFYINP